MQMLLCMAQNATCCLQRRASLPRERHLWKAIFDGFTFVSLLFRFETKQDLAASLSFFDCQFWIFIMSSLKFTAVVVTSEDNVVHVIRANELQQFSRLWIDAPSTWPAQCVWLREDADLICKLLKIDSKYYNNYIAYVFTLFCN